MEKHKKQVLIIIGIVLALLAILAAILSLFIKEDKKDNNKNKPIPIQNTLSKEIEELDDVNIFFSLQNVINNYYDMLRNRDTSDLLDILDSDYLNTNNINSSNLYSILATNLQSTSFVIKQVYYNPNSYLTYYFINGYFTNVSISDDDDFSEYIPNMNFLIIVDSSRNYELRPLDRNVNIETFAKSYDITDKNISSSKKMSNNVTDEKTKLSIYISEFLNLMFYDGDRAYNMLTDETKKKYINKEDFKNRKMDIYNNLATSIFAYSKKEDNNTVIYNIKDDKQNSITITEYKIMDYKMAY